MPLNQAPSTQPSPGVVNKHLQNSNTIELQKIIVRSPHKTQKLEKLMLVDEADAMKGSVVPPLPVSNKYKESLGLISRITPDYKINRNFLSLSKVSINRRKEALMFVFLMNKEKVDPNKTTVISKDNRKRLHILGSKKMFPDQKVFDNEYPVNVSVSKYDDGLAPQEWNFILPNKKPREVRIALMWAF